MSADVYIVGGILAVAIVVVFVTEWVRVDLVALMVLPLVWPLFLGG